MKKAVVLGMILLAIGGMAFADGVTVGMDFGRTQFNLASALSGNGLTSDQTAVRQGWIGPTEQFPTGQRLDIQLAWSNDHTGVNFTGYLGNATMSWVNAYGTLKLIPDMFTVQIGEQSGDGWDHFRWDSAHPIHDVDNHSVGRFSGWGAILDLMPKDTGFEAALYLHTGDPTANGSYSYFGATGGAVQQLANMASNYGFAASYMVPNLLKVQAGSQAFGLYPTPQRNIFAGVQLLAIPNLTAFDSFWYAGFDQATSVTIYSDELALSYDMKPLTLILAAFFGQNDFGGFSLSPAALPGVATPDYSRGQNGGSDYTVWAVQPEVIYNMGMLSLGLYASIMSTSISNFGISYIVEPYVKLNDFGLRISFLYAGSTATNATSSWEIPVLIDWGF